ncbi:MAG: T9SS type A sorting domain-containing protein [Fibrobacteria bacterium]|nr:T9SS type A sorting domain-containing protein [Fibrobacteria bacterium]
MMIRKHVFRIILVLGLLILGYSLNNSESFIKTFSGKWDFNKLFSNTDNSNAVSEGFPDVNSLIDDNLFRATDDEEEYEVLKLKNIPIPGFPKHVLQIPDGEVKDVSVFSMLGTKISSSSDTSSLKVLDKTSRGVFFVTVTYGDGTSYTEKLIDLK